MIKKDVRLELPRQAGGQIEFMLQIHEKNKCACNAHIHNAAELLYVVNGSYDLTLDNIPYKISEGDLILFCSGAIHYIVAGENEINSYYVIKIPPSFLIGFASNDTGAEYAMRFALNRKENKCVWRKEELLESEIKHVLDALINEHTQKKHAFEITLKLKIMELLVAILRTDAPNRHSANDQTTRLIYSAMCHIQEKYSEEIDEKELAKSYGMSYSYFSRSFKRVTGITFKEYLNRTRISNAERFLFQNGGLVSDAATACGYNSISYFISVYRAITGTTPYKALKQKTGA